MRKTKAKKRTWVAWSQDDVRLLKKMYADGNRRETANKLGRTVGAITAKASALGLTDKIRAWSQKELRLLKRLYPSNTAEQIARQIGRRVWSVRKKVVVLGLRKRFRYADCHRVVKGAREKLCRKCEKWQDESQFFGDSGSKDGLKIYCKSCDTEAQREYRAKRVKEVRQYLRFEERHRTFCGDKQKLCSCCKQWKNETQFYRNRSARDGLGSHCTECGRQKNKGAKKYIRFEDRHRVVKGVRQKLCCKCERWKNESDFCRNRAEKDGLGYRCRECAYKPAGKSDGWKPKSVRKNLRYEERHRVVDGVRQKLCRKCGKWKNESDFYNNRSAKDGLNDSCKKCAYKPTGKPPKP